jgi:hypothetical protein
LTIPTPAGAQANATNAAFRIGQRGFARAVPAGYTTANTVKCAGFPSGRFSGGQDHTTSHTAMALYKSEITQFLEELKTQKPDLEAQQRQGRSLLWDKDPIDLEERARAKSARVAQKPYVYSLD